MASSPLRLLPALLLTPLWGQEERSSLPSLRELLATQVTVASRNPETLRETAGVVTLITREEIQASGARDLVDILRLVPGFDFGYDVQGVIGPSVRGLWAYEGKVLLLWDGVEMNEVLYSTIPLGGRFPVDQIRRVEVIRGPGSAIYGGSAEVAVVQITSLAAEDLPALGGGLALGRGSGITRRTAQAVGTWAGEAVTLTFGAFLGSSLRSEGVYTDPAGTEVSLRDEGRIRPLFAHLGLQSGGFEGKVVVDQYKVEERDDLGLAPPRATDNRFDSTSVDLRYRWDLAPGLALTPTLAWRSQKPWWVTSPAPSLFQYTATRWRGGLALAWAPTPALDVSMGLERLRDSSEALPPRPSFFPGGAREVAYDSTAAFGQLQARGPVNLTIGARWERHDAVGSAFVPRLALTRAWARWHLKALFAHAFRTPGILNLNQTLDPTRPIEPEKTRTTEVEVGVETGSSLLTLNLFDTTIRKPLVYTVQGAASGYLNQDRTGSRGAELEWKLRREWGFLNATYSLHRARNAVALWAVPEDGDRFLGLSPQKATLWAGWRLGPGWTVGGSAVWMDERWARAWDPAAGSLRLQRLPADLLLGATLTWAARGLTVALSLQDALDRQRAYAQPYDGGHGPLPGLGREWVLKLRHGF